MAKKIYLSAYNQYYSAATAWRRENKALLIEEDKYPTIWELRSYYKEFILEKKGYEYFKYFDKEEVKSDVFFFLNAKFKINIPDNIRDIDGYWALDYEIIQHIKDGFFTSDQLLSINLSEINCVEYVISLEKYQTTRFVILLHKHIIDNLGYNKGKETIKLMRESPYAFLSFNGIKNDVIHYKLEFKEKPLFQEEEKPVSKEDKDVEIEKAKINANIEIERKKFATKTAMEQLDKLLRDKIITFKEYQEGIKNIINNENI